MNVTALRAIVASVTSSVTCPNDGAGYTEDDLVVISALDRRAVLIAQCPRCHSAILISAAVQAASEKERPISVKPIATEGSVTLDDVTSVHEVLRDFSGDLSALLNGVGD